MTENKQEALNLNSNDDVLIFAHVMFRHGERNIVAPSYPNDPYEDEKHWPEGFGQLTNEGKRQQFRLGQYFRRRYGKILGVKYSPKNIYIQSTDFDRTIMSAQANLSGLFPPTDDEKWSDEIAWQPIPVHTLPMSIDDVFIIERSCPKFEVALKKHKKECPEVQRIYTEHADLFKYMTEHSGQTIETIGDVFHLYNTLITEKGHNKQLPAWTDKVIEPNGTIEYIAKYFFKLYADTPQLARLKAGFLLKEIFQRFSQKINLTLQPDRSFWMYSAHDFTISILLNSLGLYKLHFPPYASSLHFELYKTKQNEHYIQIFYRQANEEYPKPLNLPGCGEKFSVEQFLEAYKEIIPDDDDHL